MFRACVSVQYIEQAVRQLFTACKMFGQKFLSFQRSYVNVYNER